VKFSRRDFIVNTALGSAALAVPAEAQRTTNKDHHPPLAKQVAEPGVPKRPAIICKTTGIDSLDAAYDMLARGDDTLDAVLKVCKDREDDPNDDTVGYGGLPNEEGVVELDSCCMHGPSRRAGAVGGVRNIRNVCLVAREVYRHTGHVMLVGEGAERFAVDVGFRRENLLTEHARKTWLLWKEYNSDQDWWGQSPEDPAWKPPAPMKVPPQAKLMSPEEIEERLEHLQARARELGIEPQLCRKAAERVLFPPTGTIHVSAVNAKGEMSAATTTSGLAWKLPGRLGDSPIIGAGCYCDQDVGSAGATGSGEENIKVAGAHTIVENMRHGMPPQEAGMDALKRIVRNYNNDMNKLRFIDMTYYILRKDGAYACVSLWEGYSEGHPHKMAVHDGTRRAEVAVSLFKGYSQDFPPEPMVPEDLKKEYLK